MSPQLYFAVMLITNPQKARRILLAEELENWFMDLFDEEREDIYNGTFTAKQEYYINKIVDKYLEITGVKMTNSDSYSESVIKKAFKTASEIQETTYNHIVVEPVNSEAAKYITSGIAIGATMFANEDFGRWLSEERANLIALNEANWKWNNEEYFDAKSRYTKKIWHTALDEKVRLTHMLVEGVEVGIDEPFHVGGYLMNYPLDSSLGASATEIINCRCTVEYK